jgi:hypothetical protein
MKNLFKFLTVLTILSGSAASAQIGVGTTTPDASAVLDVASTTKGLLAPRHTTTTRNAIVTPANGLLIYNTTTNQLETNNGTTVAPVWTAVGASNSTLYNANGTTTAARTVTLGANPLSFTSSATNGFSVDGTTFSVDAVTNRIGIGTATPGTALDVIGEAKATRLLAYGPGNLSSNTAIGSLSLNSNTTGADNIAIGANSLSSNTTGGQNTAVGSSLAVNTTGNYNTSLGALSLNNSTIGSKNTAIGRFAGNSITTGSNNLVLGTSGTGITTGSGNVVIGNDISGLSSTLTNNIVIADGAGNRRINVDGSGNVGIANAAPTEKLDVTGNVKFSGALMPNNTAGTAGQVLTSAGAGSVPTWTTVAAGTTYTAGSGLTLTGSAFSANDATTLAKGTVQLAGDLSGTSALPTIATDAVTSAKILDATVANADLAAGAGGIYKGSGSLAAATTITGAANTLAITSTATNGFSVDGTTLSVDAANNRVGIGTSSPSQKLVVAGDQTGTGTGAPATTGSTSTALFRLRSNTTGGEVLDMGSNIINAANSYSWIQATNSDDLTLKYKLALNPNGGNVGIGTAAPQSALHVNEPSDNTQLVISRFLQPSMPNGSSLYQKMGYADDGSRGVVDLAFVKNASSLLNQFSIGFSGFSPSFYITSGTGNVGIANAAPTERLDVTGNVKFSGALMPNNTAGTAGQVLTSAGAGAVPTWTTPTAGSTYTAGTSMVLSGTEFQRAALTGDVTAAANSNATTIAADAVTSAKILDGTIAAADLAADAVTSAKIVDATVANADLAAGVGGIYKGSGSLAGNTTVTAGTNTLAITSSATTGTSHFTVDGTTLNVDAANNRVGIGTATPGAALDVNGEARATRLLAYGAGNLSSNTAIGTNSLSSNTTGFLNTGVGQFSLQNNTTGFQNTGIGHSLVANTGGSNNSALGYLSLVNNSTGSLNTAIGLSAGSTITTGSNNVVLGYSTTGITTGSGNVVIGNSVTTLSPTLSNNVVIADGAGNRRINVDGSGNVGIANAAPTEKLDVTGNVKFSGALMPNNLSGTAGQVLTSQGTGTPTWTTVAAGTAYTAGTSMVLSGTEFQRAALSGDVNAAVNSNATTIAADAVTSTKILDATVANVDLAAGAGGIYKGSGSLAGNTTVTAGTNTLAITSTATNGFSVDGTTLSVDAANNRIGIGTSAPASLLHVNETGTGTGAVLARFFQPNMQTAASVYQKMGYADDGLRGTVDLAFMKNTDPLFNQFAIGFSGFSPSFYITSGTGNVGIANAAPTERLDVTGNIRFSGALMPNNNAGTTGQVLTSAGAGAVPTWTTVSGGTTYTAGTSMVLSGSEFQRAALTGDVTAAVNSNATTIAADAVTSAKILDGTVANADLAAGTGGIYKGSGSLTAATTVTGGANTLAITSTATNGFSVDGTTLSVDAANNRIGIGTSTPASKLEVDGSVTNKSSIAATSLNIDFSASNLAYTTSSAGLITLSNVKDGGTYTLNLRGTTTGTSTFAATGFTFKTVNNGATTTGKETIYTFLVLGTVIYVYMVTGI